MQLKSAILILGLGLSLAACDVADVATRNAPFEQLPTSPASVPAGYELSGTAVAPVPQAGQAAPAAANYTPGTSPFTIVGLSVVVPASLKVSEANTYLPHGDIVWRGDPIGNRHKQVETIFRDAIKRGIQPLDGPRKVNLHIQVQKFHALTEKARYTTGGVHAISFVVVLRDARTGEQLGEPHLVRADLDAFGGKQAILAESQGLTQKVRISAHLAEVIRQELTIPGGYAGAKTGFIGALNYL